METAKLALEDGTVFTGRAFGARGEADGEVVFNTSMTGYQEILTDPSYHGQIVAMTYPLIGNYGVNAEDAESRRPWVRGFVVRELSRLVSNHRAAGSLDAYLAEHDVLGIEGIDTRALVRLTRERGAMKGIVSTTDLDDSRLVAKAQASPGLVGRDLVSEVMPGEASTWEPGFESRFAAHSAGADLERLADAAEAARGRARLRHEVEHPPPPRRMRLPGHGRPGVDPAGGDPGARARRHLPLERARRPPPARRGDRHAQDPGPVRRRGARHPDLRHLPGPSAPRPGLRRAHVQAQVRPPGGEPSRPQ